MKLYRVILPVGNIDEADRFYTAILGMQGQRVSPGRHYFNLEGTVLACYDARADGDDENPRWVHHENQYLYIAVDDLEAVFDRVRNSDVIRVDHRIERMPWGERLFYLNDPWGNPVCFVERGTEFMGEE